MLFNRNKTQNEPAARVGLTDGIERKVAAFVKEWGALQRGQREFVADSQDEPLQLLTDADVALFTRAMEDELARVEADLMAEMNREHNARIAQMDAEIAAKNRALEASRAKLVAQDADIRDRGDRLYELRSAASKIAPGLSTDGLVEWDIIREVVRMKVGDAAASGMTQDQLEARFDILASSIPAQQDPFQRVMKDGLRPLMDAKQAAEAAHQQMVDELTNAWKETRH